MKNFKSLTLSLAALLMLGACGDGFKASQLLTQEDVDREAVVASENAPEGQTPVSVDQEIYNSYLSELSAVSASAIQELRSDVLTGGMEAQIVETGVRGSSNQVTVRVEFWLNCQESVVLTGGGDIFNGERIVLNQANGSDYHMSFQCTDSDCSEAFTALRKVQKLSLTNFQPVSILLIGLIQENQSVSGTQLNRTYQSRAIPNITASGNHFASPQRLSEYGNSCLSVTQGLTTPTTTTTNTSNTGSTAEVADPSQYDFTGSFPVYNFDNGGPQ